MTSDPAIRAQVLQYFLQEAPELLATMEQELQNLQQQFDVQTVNTLMRTAHTLKGAASTIGLETVRRIAKSLEDIFRSLCRSDAKINSQIQQLLAEGADCLRLAVLAQCIGDEIDDAEILDRMSGIEAQLREQIDDGGSSQKNPLLSSAELGYDLTRSIFETGVNAQLKKIEAAIERGNPREIAIILRTQAQIFLGLAEAQNLRGFGEIAQTTLDALNHRPDQTMTIAEIALKDFRAGQDAIMAGDRVNGGEPSKRLKQLAIASTTSEPAAASPKDKYVRFSPQPSEEDASKASDPVKDFLMQRVESILASKNGTNGISQKQEAPSLPKDDLWEKPPLPSEPLSDFPADNPPDTSDSTEDIWGQALSLDSLVESPLDNLEPPESNEEDIWGQALSLDSSFVDAPADDPEPSIPEFVASNPIIGSGQKVLIIDDSLTIRQTLTLIFEQEGYQVVQAGDGYEAIEQFDRHNDIELIICDIEMPRMDGLEFLSFRKHARELAAVPVVVLTSLEDETHRVLALQLGATTYITKQYLKEKLLATAKVLLEKTLDTPPPEQLERSETKPKSALGNRLLIGVAALGIIASIGGGLWWYINQRPNPEGTSSETVQPKTFAQANNIPKGLFSYGGSTTWAPIRLAVDPALQNARPDFRLRFVEPTGTPPGSDTGIKMLIEGQLNFAQSSRPLTREELQQAQQRGFSLKQIQVAIDGITVAVHPDLKVTGLTLEQLKGIYSGQITNWKQINGQDIPITIFARDPKTSGTVELFAEQVLGGQSFGANLQVVPTVTQGIRRLAKTPGGIFFASAPELVPQCSIKSLSIAREARKFVAPYQGNPVPPDQCQNRRNQINTEGFRTTQYPLTRYLYVIVKANGKIEEQAGNAYADLLLSNQGQAAISNAGFVSIR
jgi:phosphate transport system substrate-binding protein